MRQLSPTRSEAMTEGGLGRLIETEARIAAALAAAETEAAELLQAARVAAEAEEHRFGELLEGATASLAARVSAERDAEIARVAAAAEERCRRLQELPEDLVEELVAWVTQRLLADTVPGSGP